MTGHRFHPHAATCPHCGGEFWKRAQFMRLCLACYLEQRGNAPTAPRAGRGNAGGIPPDMLGRLIRLCHPDKHGNSEAANVATAWLLEQRGTHATN